MKNTEIKDIKRMYQVEGMTCQQIAEKLGVSKTTVHRRIKKFHITGKRQKKSGFRIPDGNRRLLDGKYEGIYYPDNPMADRDGYVRTHDYIMSQIIGRPIEWGEVVHHIDGNPRNNDPENLALMTLEEHSRLHAYIRWAKRKGVPCTYNPQYIFALCMQS